MGKEYYLAYEERYKKVHERGLRWSLKIPTPEVLEWIKFNNINKEDEILEIGCGEGRDALYLGEKEYNIIGVDASNSAISKCEELSKEKDLNIQWVVDDALYLSKLSNKKFKWIYSVATLHMLVESKHRKQFLKTIFNILKPNGKLLLVNMGDGQAERRTNPSTAFELQERTMMNTNEKLMVAGTSYRGINWDNHKEELLNAGFTIEKAMITTNDEYYKCMTVYLKRKE